MSAIDSFKQIVGCDNDDFAASFLKNHSNNLEAAVQAFYGNDSGMPSTMAEASVGASASPSASVFDDARERAPLPQFRDTLIDINPGQQQRRRTLQTNAATHPLEAFRDFRTEATSVASADDGINASDGAREMFGLTKKPKNLAELYRAPTEICFVGSFDELRDTGRRQSRWLLVNIQSPTEFASQQLNRDTWRDETLRELVKARCVCLWLPTAYHVSAALPLRIEFDLGR